jgi:hypothetical protein
VLVRVVVVLGTELVVDAARSSPGDSCAEEMWVFWVLSEPQRVEKTPSEMAYLVVVAGVSVGGSKDGAASVEAAERGARAAPRSAPFAGLSPSAAGGVNDGDISGAAGAGDIEVDGSSGGAASGGGPPPRCHDSSSDGRATVSAARGLAGRRA